MANTRGLFKSGYLHRSRRNATGARVGEGLAEHHPRGEVEHVTRPCFGREIIGTVLALHLISFSAVVQRV